VEYLVRGTTALRTLIHEGADQLYVRVRLIAAAGDVVHVVGNHGTEEEADLAMSQAYDALLACSDLHETIPRQWLSTILFCGQNLSFWLHAAGRPGEVMDVASACTGWADEWSTSELASSEVDSLARLMMYVGHSLKDLEQYAEAQEVYETELDLREQLHDRDPRSFHALHWLGASHHNLGTTFREQKDPQVALEHLQQAEVLQRQALEREPDNREALGFLCNHLSELSITRSALGDHEAAIEMALGLADGRDGTRPDSAFAAYTLGPIVAILQGSEEESVEREKLVERATRACLACLQRASRGESAAQIQWDSSCLDPIRDHPEFQDLLRGARGKSQ
jgi:tetratricopeptide (TPR) repeat protein